MDGNTFSLFVSSLSLQLSLQFIIFPPPLPLFFHTVNDAVSSDNNDLFIMFFFSIDLWQRVKAAAPAAFQLPSLSLYPPPLHHPRCPRLQLDQTTPCQTVSQEFCLRTWRTWRYLETVCSSKHKRKGQLKNMPINHCMCVCVYILGGRGVFSC